MIHILIGSTLYEAADIAIGMGIPKPLNGHNKDDFKKLCKLILESTTTIATGNIYDRNQESKTANDDLTIHLPHGYTKATTARLITFIDLIKGLGLDFVVYSSVDENILLERYSTVWSPEWPDIKILV